jgi:peptide/nickel transport system permease protein
VHYLGDVFTGNFGTSLFYFPTPVGTVVGGAIWWTMGLVGVTTILAFILGTGVGIIAAWRRGGVLDGIAPPLLVITSAIPYFWVGMMFILIFGLKLRWLPWSGGFDISDTPAWTASYIGDVFEHAVLPALALLTTTIGTWTLTMRNNMVTTLAEDYVRMARAKGLKPWRIMWTYAGRNAILPNLVGFAMSLGFVVGGAILVEFVFNYPGVGWMFLQSVENQDYALMQALFLMITVTVLLAILAADIATAILDPRTRERG